MGDHEDGSRGGSTSRPVDYLKYLRRTRRTLLSGLGLTVFFGLLLAVRIVNDFDESSSQGLTTLLNVLITLGALFVLTGLFLIGVWVPCAIRTSRLRLSLADASYYLVKPIPHFWDQLNLVNPRRSNPQVRQNATLSIDGAHASLWRGTFKPELIASLPMTHLLRIETDRAGVTPFRRRIVLVIFEVDGEPEELPLALRTFSSLGYARLSIRKQHRFIERLELIAQAPPQMS